MEIRHLRYFLAVARHRHFTQAAEELFIAQSALSQQIRALEEDLGVALFERTSRHVALTPAGEEFLVYVERILGEIEQARAAVQVFAGGTRGRICIGMLASLGSYRLPALLERFHQSYPGIEVVLREDATEQLVEQVRIGQLDLAFTHAVGKHFPRNLPDTQLASKIVVTENVVLVAAPHHPLASRASISPAELSQEPFLFFKSGSGLRYILSHVSQTGNFTPHVLFESGDIGTLRALASEGLGIAALPVSIVESPGREVAILHLDPPPLPRTVMIVWQKQSTRKAAAQIFLNFLDDDLNRHPWR
jgi:DNA-binding transcriptional LysR family regulator